MKKIYQAPTSTVYKVTPAELICDSPGTGYTTTNLTEEKNVVFDAKGDTYDWDEE